MTDHPSEEEINRQVAEFIGEIESQDLNLYVKELRKSLPRKARWSYYVGNVIAGIMAVTIGFLVFLIVVLIVKGLIWLTKAIF